MEWIISGIITLLLFWLVYCFYQRIEYDSYFERNRFKELTALNKLVIITLWIVIIIFAITLFALMVMVIKYTIFGK